MTNDSGASYFGTDILGSVRNVTDKYGTVQADYSYDAFGSPYLGNLDNDIGFGYCGKVYDIGTGLYDYGFRDYSPNNARFTTVDPIRDGSNWFSYVVNDPVNYVDPLGLSTSDRGSSPKFNSGMFGQNIGFDGFTINTPFSNDQKSEFSPFGPYFTATTITGHSFDLSGGKKQNNNGNQCNIISLSCSIIAGIKCNGIEITKEVALDSLFKIEQMEKIICGQKLACDNLDKIIAKIKNGELVKLANKYLNMDLTKEEDKSKLLRALNQIKTSLAGKYPNQFQAGRTGDHEAYVKENGWTTRWLDNKYSRTYENIIYFDVFAFDQIYAMDNTLVHEESHINLYTEDFYYEVDGYKLDSIDAEKKQINADNWRKFYAEAKK